MDSATTESYTYRHARSLNYALPISERADQLVRGRRVGPADLEQPDLLPVRAAGRARSEEHTSELQSLMRRSYDVFCLNKNDHTVCQLLHAQQHHYVLALS